MEWIERYSKSTRTLHWVHTAAFIILFLTGLIIFTPFLAFLGQDSWTRLIHRVAAIIFVIGPLIFFLVRWKSAVKGVFEAFKWGKKDIGWLLAAPRYYFLNDEKAMPPQGHMNTGQKMWWLMVLICGAIFIITGAIMWFARAQAPEWILQWSLILHDLAFLATGAMFLVHVYLSVIHPLMRPLHTGAWSSMYRGRVSYDYARSHHAEWYAEISQEKKAKTVD